RRTEPRRAPKPPAPAPAAAEPPALSGDVATLRFTSDVPGTQVFLDRQFVGTAPVSAPNVKPGSHRLNASVEGFDGIAETIDVEPGPRDVPIRFREVRLDAKVAVVHKHRFGSCTGELSATPRELRYATSNVDDAFRVAMADVESIDVDYLQKNLRVKLRKGKTYNFTAPDGNADRLFVFQRDVEKARQRLARGDQPAD
ncbi:MAG TPA: PEGA domain-containing protein, partial [Vicinamibacterales bacterium]|nr:PEGA domain-containing protein [Vicinamibacterales bacterium]